MKLTPTIFMSAEADTNHDGFIDFEEYKSFVRTKVNIMIYLSLIIQSLD
jgi:hypothetical protein